MSGLRRQTRIFGPAAGIVETDLVIQNAVEADGLEVRRQLDGVKIVAVAGAKSQNGVARAEGLLPEMRERSRGAIRIDDQPNRGGSRWRRGALVLRRRLRKRSNRP